MECIRGKCIQLIKRGSFYILSFPKGRWKDMATGDTYSYL